MLAELVDFGTETTLIMRSGVQFMDFGMTPDFSAEMPGQFSLGAGGSVLRLDYEESTGKTFLPGTREAVRPHLDLDVADSLRLLEDLWLPVPFLRRHHTLFAEGPVNWARARLVSLGEHGPDSKGNTHRLVIALDTGVDETEAAGSLYLVPSLTDVASGARFALAWRNEDAPWFPEQPWVAGWLAEVFRERGESHLRLSPEDVADQESRFQVHKAHYLNFLYMIGKYARTPALAILSNRPDNTVRKPIPVDLVLDVGNSRTCGILIEDHPQEHDGLRHRYVMELRDLSRPHLVYSEPFESRVEFSEAVFGKVDQSCYSGRNDAFLWPTIARIGPEASRLASRRRGTEGTTGLSSPKRYLWDEERYEPGWRFNGAFNQAESEPLATARPFSSLVNELGEALFALEEDERYQVFMPHYSRSSLMTFMLAEVLVQALGQCNSPGQRMKQSHANTPRQLRSMILTVPPSMPLAERQIFDERIRQAIVLVWKAMGWHPEDAPLDGPWAESGAWPPLPVEIRTQWDEATAAQVVYLYSQVVNHFAGRPGDFFRTIRRPRPGQAESGILTIASIDIGGGTTDLVINDYLLDDGRGANVSISPRQRFHDGFKVAGDDIVLQVIEEMILPVLRTELQGLGIRDPQALLSRLMGSEAGIVQRMVLRQQIALQIFYPLALALLKAFEDYDPLDTGPVSSETIGALLGSDNRPSADVLEYLSREIRAAAGPEAGEFDLLQVRLPMDNGRLHQLFLEDRLEVCKSIRALCEIAWLYDCDVLLVSGRPSRLPGIQALFRALLPLPPDRIIPLHNFRTGNWYPFHRQERIDDPKTTAVVGAMLCVLGQGRIPNFFFRADLFRLRSTIRHIGILDHNMAIKDSDVYYSGVDLDNKDYEFPEISFEMRGRMVLGHRQLAVARWGASPLFLIDFARDRTEARDALFGRRAGSSPDTATGSGEAGNAQNTGNVLNISLRRGRKPSASPCPDGQRLPRESVAIARVTTGEGRVLSPASVQVRLNTLDTIGIGGNSYWLDTGSIVR